MHHRKYLVRRSTDGLFFFRAVIPNDLRPILRGKKEFRLSLHTHDQKQAGSLSLVLHETTQAIFLQMRWGQFQTDTVQFIKSRLQPLVNQQIKLHQPFPSFQFLLPAVSPVYRDSRTEMEHPPSNYPTVSEAFAQFKAEKLKSNAWTEKTIMEYESCVSQFIEIVGDLRIDEVTRTITRQYKASLFKLPPNRNKDPRFATLPIEDVLDTPKDHTISSTTINKHLRNVGSLFRWAERNFEEVSNPLDGLKLIAGERPQNQREVFTPEEIARIFKPRFFDPETQGKPHRFWIPLIALYTGARLDEICQLHLADLRKEQGIWVFDINDHSENPAHPKKLKNRASERIVPVHSYLIQADLLEYRKSVPASDVRLFPQLSHQRGNGYSRKVGRWFNERYLREVLEIRNKKKTFHSFRHTVGNQLKQKGVAESYIAELLGHSKGGETMGRYGKAYRPEVLLREAVDKLAFELRLERALRVMTAENWRS